MYLFRPLSLTDISLWRPTYEIHKASPSPGLSDDMFQSSIESTLASRTAFPFQKNKISCYYSKKAKSLVRAQLLCPPQWKEDLTVCQICLVTFSLRLWWKGICTYIAELKLSMKNETGGSLSPSRFISADLVGVERRTVTWLGGVTS